MLLTWGGGRRDHGQENVNVNATREMTAQLTLNIDEYTTRFLEAEIERLKRISHPRGVFKSRQIKFVLI